MKTAALPTWRVPAVLLVLSLVPTLGGVARLANLGAAAPTADTQRFFEGAASIVLHVVASTLFALLGAFQFSAGVRRRWPRWHRMAGRVAAAAGLLSGLSGTWMTLTFAIPPALQGPLLFVARLLVGPAVVVAIGLAVAAILRRDVATHEAWMIRAYALAQGAGTQAVLLGPLMLAVGDLTHGARDALMVLAWVLNVVVAEVLVRGRASMRVAPLAG